MNYNWYLIAFVIIFQGGELQGWDPDNKERNSNFNIWSQGFFEHTRQLVNRKGGSKEIILLVNCPPPPLPQQLPPNCLPNKICKLPPTPLPLKCLSPSKSTMPGPSIPISPLTALTCDNTKPGETEYDNDCGSHNNDHGSHNDDHGSHNDDHGSHNKDKGSHNKDNGSHNKDKGSHNKDNGSHNKDSHSDDNNSHNDDNNSYNDDNNSHNDDNNSHNDDNELQLLTVKIPNYAVPKNIGTYLQNCNGNWKWNTYVTFSLIEQWAQQFLNFYRYSNSFWIFVLSNFPGLFAYTSTNDTVQLIFQVSNSIIVQLTQNPSWGTYNNGLWIWPIVQPTATSSANTTITFTISTQIIQLVKQSEISSYVQNINGNYQWFQNIDVNYWADYFTKTIGFSIPFWSYIISDYPQLFSNSSNLNTGTELIVRVPLSALNLINSFTNKNSPQLIELLQEKYGSEYNTTFWNFMIYINQYFINGTTINLPIITINTTILSQVVQIIQQSNISSYLYKSSDGSYSWNSNFDSNYWAEFFSNETSYPYSFWNFILNVYPSIFASDPTINSVTITFEIPYVVLSEIKTSNLLTGQLSQLLQSQYGNTIEFWNFIISLQPYLQIQNQNNGIITLPPVPTLITNITFIIPNQVTQFIQQSSIKSYLDNSNGSWTWKPNFNLTDWSNNFATQTGYPSDFWAFILSNYLPLFASSNLNNATLSFTVPYFAIAYVNSRPDSNSQDVINYLINNYGQNEIFWKSLISVKMFLVLQDKFNGFINLPNPLTTTSTTTTTTTTTTPIPLGGYDYSYNLTGVPCAVVPIIQNSNLTLNLQNINPNGTPQFVWNDLNYAAWINYFVMNFNSNPNNVDWPSNLLFAIPSIINNIAKSRNISNLSEIFSKFNIEGCPALQ